MATSLKKPVRDYIDVDFSFAKHPLSDNVSTKKNINAVKQSIKHLLLLRSGDKPFHPEIKSPIYDYLFENGSAVVQVVLEGEVRKYLGVYENRIQVTYVKVSYPSPNELRCEVAGTIINLQEPFTVSILVERLR